MGSRRCAVGSDLVVDDVPDKTSWAGVGGGAVRRLPPVKPLLTLEGSMGGEAAHCKALCLEFRYRKMSVHRVALFLCFWHRRSHRFEETSKCALLIIAGIILRNNAPLTGFHSNERSPWSGGGSSSVPVVGMSLDSMIGI